MALINTKKRLKRYKKLYNIQDETKTQIAKTIAEGRSIAHIRKYVDEAIQEKILEQTGEKETYNGTYPTYTTNKEKYREKLRESEIYQDLLDIEKNDKKLLKKKQEAYDNRYWF